MSRANELFEQDMGDLHKVLIEIRDLQKKQSSLRWNFFRGVVYGFGVFVGSVLLVAVIVYILSKLQIDGNTFFGDLVQKFIDAANNTTK